MYRTWVVDCIGQLRQDLKWIYDLRSYERNFCNCVDHNCEDHSFTWFHIRSSYMYMIHFIYHFIIKTRSVIDSNSTCTWCSMEILVKELQLIDLFFACTFLFSQYRSCDDAQRSGPLFCSFKRVHAEMFMLACTFFNEQNKGLNLLSTFMWSVLGKPNVQAKKVYYSCNYMYMYQSCSALFFNHYVS